MWTYAGPLSLLLTLAVATWRLRSNAKTWGDLGFKRPDSIWKTVMWALVVLVATIAAGIGGDFIGSYLFAAPDGAAALADERYANRFVNVPGNLPVFLFWITVAWVIGGFTEELIFRGFLISRFEGVFARLPMAIGIAILLQAIIFGQQHFYYQGAAGMLATGAAGLVSGIAYVLLKRNLWPVILAHGLSNTLGLTLLYFDIAV